MAKKQAPQPNKTTKGIAHEFKSNTEELAELMKQKASQSWLPKRRSKISSTDTESTPAQTNTTYTFAEGAAAIARKFGPKKPSEGDNIHSQYHGAAKDHFAQKHHHNPIRAIQIELLEKLNTALPTNMSRSLGDPLNKKNAENAKILHGILNELQKNLRKEFRVSSSLPGLKRHSRLEHIIAS